MIMNKLKNNPIVYLAIRTWKFSRGKRHYIVSFLILYLIAIVIFLMQPLVIAKVLNTIQEQGVGLHNLYDILLLLSLIVAISLGFWVFHGPGRYIEMKNAFWVKANYKQYLVDGVMDLPPDWHQNHHSGDTIDKIDKATDGLFRYADESFFIVQGILMLVGSYIALAIYNLHAAYITLILIFGTGFVIVKFDGFLLKQYIKLFKADNKIAAKVYDAISNITTVIILRIQKSMSKAINAKITEPFPLYKRTIRISEIKWFIVGMSSSLLLFLVIGSYIFFNVRAGIPIVIGTIYALYGYSINIDHQFFRFTLLYSDLVRYKSAVQNAEEISDEFRIKKKNESVKLENDWKSLSIKALDFSYHTKEGEDLHLDDINLEVKRGEKIAFIGASGSGKTTMLKIMRELYKPKSLNLCLDEKSLKDGFSSLSQKISLIPQDPEIFSTTIKENITLGLDRTMAHIKKFTDLACFTEVANKLPNKFQSDIFEKGVNLSTGQKQRLALARGLMAFENKSILLLDEPTSSVDFKNELKIHKNIFKEFKDKTIISSIHRLNLLPLFDKIVYFKDGKIAAQGTFKEIYKNSKEFGRMWDKYTKAKNQGK
jgi:ATP-binding cassette, subfamily B, bacterial